MSCAGGRVCGSCRGRNRAARRHVYKRGEGGGRAAAIHQRTAVRPGCCAEGTGAAAPVTARGPGRAHASPCRPCRLGARSGPPAGCRGGPYRCGRRNPRTCWFPCRGVNAGQADALPAGRAGRVAGAHPSPVPEPLSVSSAGVALPYTVELHRFVLVREPAAAVQSFLLAHVPAGMTWAGDGLGWGTANTITVLSVGYSPRSVASGLTDAELGTNAMRWRAAIL